MKHIEIKCYAIQDANHLATQEATQEATLGAQALKLTARACASWGLTSEVYGISSIEMALIPSEIQNS